MTVEFEPGVEGRVEGELKDEDEDEDEPGVEGRESSARPQVVSTSASGCSTPRTDVWIRLVFRVELSASGNFPG